MQLSTITRSIALIAAVGCYCHVIAYGSEQTQQPHASVSWTKLKSLYDANDFKSCLKYAEQDTQQTPSDPNGYLYSGLVYWRMEDFARAIPRLNKAIAMIEMQKGTDRSWLAWTYASLGECYIGVGDTQKAIEALTAGLRHNPKVEICLIHRAEAYCQLKDFDSALRDATALVQSAPQKTSCYLFRSRIYLDAGQYKPAAGDLSKALALGGASAELYSLRARAYDNLGEHDLAQADRRRSQTYAKELLER